MNAITSTTAVRKAYEATASLSGFWAAAYEATASDIAGGVSVRDIADAWKAAKITPANKDSVTDMGEAHRLTVFGDSYAAAVAGMLGEGAILAAHMLIGRARKARGISYVRAVLTDLENAADTGDEDNTDALAKAMSKAVRTLNAAKREEKKDTGDDTDTDTDTGDVDTDTDAATADTRADSVIAVLAAMIKDGDVPDAARQRTIIESVRALMSSWKADAGEAAA